MSHIITRQELLHYQPRHPFGRKSLAVRSTLSNNMIRFVNCVADKWDISLIEGVRTEARQRKLYRKGQSKTLNSRHLPNHMGLSEAVDMAPYPIDWNNEEQFIQFGFFCMGVAQGLGLDLRWGGDWDGDHDIHDQTFADRVHFEERISS